MSPILLSSAAERRRPWLAIALLLVVTAPWWLALKVPFIELDDLGVIDQNPVVQAGLTPASIKAAFTSASGGLWAPATFLSLMLDVTLWGHGPVGIHFTNVLLHIANTLLVYFFLASTTQSPGRSLIAAALWSIHPLRVESVAWAFERKDVLAIFFGLLALMAWVRYVRSAGSRARCWYAAMIAAWALSMMSKPVFVTLPLLLLLLDIWPLERLQLRWRRLLVEKLPLFLLTAAFSAITAAVQASQKIIYHDPSYTFVQRLATIFGGYLRYLRDTCYPVYLALYYDDIQEIPIAILVAGLVVVGVVTAWAVLQLRRPAAARRATAIGWCWFVLTLLPSIGIVQSGMQSRADRYTYLPSIGLILALCWLPPDRWLVMPAVRRSLVAAATVAALLLAIATTQRLLLWQEPLQLYLDGMSHTSRNHRLEFLAGAALERAKRYTEALDYFGSATLDEPKFDEAYHKMGICFVALKRYDLAVEAFRRACYLKPEDPYYRANYEHALRDLQASRAAPATAP